MFAVLVVIGLFATTNDDKAQERLDRQTQSVKNCVETLGEGVYKDKSLTWKLDSCNAAK